MGGSVREAEMHPYSTVKQPGQSTSNFLWSDWSIAVVITGKPSEPCKTPVGECVFVCMRVLPPHPCVHIFNHVSMLSLLCVFVLMHQHVSLCLCVHYCVCVNLSSCVCIYHLWLFIKCPCCYVCVSTLQQVSVLVVLYFMFANLRY